MYLVKRAKENELPPQEGKGRGEPPKDLLILGGSSLSDCALLLSFSAEHYGLLGLKPSMLQAGLPEQSPMGIIPSGMIPHWEASAKSIIQGKEGKKMLDVSLGSNTHIPTTSILTCFSRLFDLISNTLPSQKSRTTDWKPRFTELWAKTKQSSLTKLPHSLCTGPIRAIEIDTDSAAPP